MVGRGVLQSFEADRLEAIRSIKGEDAKLGKLCSIKNLWGVPIRKVGPGSRREGQKS